MPIIATRTLPAYRILRDEGVQIAQPGDSAHRHRPVLRIAILNLMPEKARTETQLARLLGDSPHWLELTFFVPDSYGSKTTPAAHLAACYERWSAIRERRFDGLIITGAPIERLPFEAVTYWRELTAVFDWARHRVGQSFYICWAAQAALHHFHGVPKRHLAEKKFGVFAHRIAKPEAPIIKDLDPGFHVPVSRHTEIRAADLPPDQGLEILAHSDESGVCLIHDSPARAHYMFNHLEYDADTLAREYERDRRLGRPVPLPRSYFPGDDPAQPPAHSWRGSARTLFRNWLNEVECHAHSRTGGAEALNWLLGGNATRIVGGPCLTDIRIGVAESLQAVPAVLRVLADMGYSPLALKVTKGCGPGSDITLLMAEVDDAAVARMARRFLRDVSGVRRVSYRDTAGAGGIIVSDGANLPERGGIPAWSRARVHHGKGLPDRGSVLLPFQRAKAGDHAP